MQIPAAGLHAVSITDGANRVTIRYPRMTNLSQNFLQRKNINNSHTQVC